MIFSVSDYAQSDISPKSVFDSCPGVSVIDSLAWQEALELAYEHNVDLIVAREELEKARATLQSAETPFYPSVNAALQNERFVSEMPNANIAVVGSNVVGGQVSTYSNYASLNTSWNLYNGGKDIAGYRAAKDSAQAAQDDVFDRSAQILGNLIDTYAALKKAELTVQYTRRAIGFLRDIETSADQRLQKRFGTQMDAQKAAITRENKERDRLSSCQEVVKQSGLLAQLLGARLAPHHIYALLDTILEAPALAISDSQLEERIQADPGVQAAKERLTSAQQKLIQARGGYRPTLALTGRYDWLGNSLDDYHAAWDQTRANSYRVGLMLQQPLFPFNAISAAINSAQADVAEAQAKYSQALITTETRLREALSAMTVTELTLESAQRSKDAAAHVLQLIQTLYERGQSDRDALSHAALDSDQEAQAAEQSLLIARSQVWAVYRALEPIGFTSELLHPKEKLPGHN